MKLSIKSFEFHCESNSYSPRAGKGICLADKFGVHLMQRIFVMWYEDAGKLCSDDFARE